MIRRTIKRLLPERQLEKVLRAKQQAKDLGVFEPGLPVLPPLNIRLGDEVFPVSPISSIPVRGWRNLLRVYEKPTPEEQAQFRRHARAMIIADAASAAMLETRLLRGIFSRHEDMYLEFLGAAYYARGDVQDALRVFRDLVAKAPTDRHYLYGARCLMHVGTDADVIALLREGLARHPASDVLWLSLANAQFRAGDVAGANASLERVSVAMRDAIRGQAHHLAELEHEIADALARKTIVRPAAKLGFQAYTEASVQSYWEDLFFHFTARSRWQHGWSDLRHITEAKIAEYLARYPDIGTVLNFGVFCAVPDYNLARSHPAVRFLGVDREQQTKQLNDTAFAADNLSFLATDMLEIIDDDRTEVKAMLRDIVARTPELMIFHARTTTLIYPEAVRRFYRSCAALGVKYIALYENMCLSRSHLKFFDFDDLPADAIPYYSVMQIHNYKKYLEEAGYEIVEKQIWNYSDLLWESRDLYGADASLGLADGHVALLARLK